MSNIVKGQTAWVRRPGSTNWVKIRVVEIPRGEPFSHDGYLVEEPHGQRSTVRPDCIRGTLSEVLKATNASLYAGDFTEDDEPQGEVPDLPPHAPGVAMPVRPDQIEDARAAHKLFSPELIVPPHDLKQFATGGYYPVERTDNHDHTLDIPPGAAVPHTWVHTCGCISQVVDNQWVTKQAHTPKEPTMRQNPDAPITMGVPGDRYTRDKVAYPQQQRRDALTQAYGILTDSSPDTVDATDAIRLAEYIVAGVDYSDTPRSIQAEALRTETDAATDLAVRKLLDAPHVADGKRWD